MTNTQLSLAELRARAQKVGSVPEPPDPPGGNKDLQALNTRCLQGLAEAGLLASGFLSPKGPAAGDLARTAAVAEGLAYASGTLASVFTVNMVFAAAVIAMLGTRKQQGRWLTRLARGQAHCAFALSEPEAGSDAAAIQTFAVSSDGYYSLTGEKLYTTGALTVDCLLVVARVGKEGREFGVFMVGRSARGVAIEPLDKLAGGAQPSCRVRLTSVQVSGAALLGGGGESALSHTWEVLQKVGALERVMVAASCVGTAESVYSEARDFALVRHQFGRPIVDFQVVQHRLVEMESTVRIMRLLVRDALKTLESDQDATIAMSTAKYVCAERLQWMAASGMRVLGGQAYLTKSVMSRLYREAPLALYAGGTIEIQKNLIAQSVGLSRRTS